MFFSISVLRCRVYSYCIESHCSCCKLFLDFTKIWDFSNIVLWWVFVDIQVKSASFFEGALTRKRKCSWGTWAVCCNQANANVCFPVVGMVNIPAEDEIWGAKKVQTVRDNGGVLTNEADDTAQKAEQESAKGATCQAARQLVWYFSRHENCAKW